MRQLLILYFIFSVFYGFSQENITSVTPKKAQETPIYQTRKNLVKFNFSSLALGNFQFQYERALNRTFSLSLSYGFVPEGAVPYMETIEDQIDDEDLVNAINDATVSYNAITPEVRIYLGKGYGKGFYFAPFYRYSKYNFKNIDVTYAGESFVNQEMSFNGDLNGNSFGLMLGTQFNLGNRLILDWWIMGPHYGTSEGQLAGISDEPLTAFEQESLRMELEDLEIPLVDTEYDVTEDGATISLNGPWAGIRAGFSLGYRF